MTTAVDSSLNAAGTFALNYSTDRGPVSRFALPVNRIVIVGRGLDVDLRLGDGLTSRRHAHICHQDGEIVIEDLESANGTWVNGQKVRRAILKAGDRVLIGVTTLEVIPELAASVALRHAAAPASIRSHDSETTIVGTARLMSGSIKEIPLADLLQLLANTRKSGVLTIRSSRDTGQVFLKDGRICRALLNDSSAVQPARTLFRLLRWESGFFELRPLGTEVLAEEIHEPTDALLLEAAQHQDEISELERRLPRLDARLGVPEDLPGEIHELSTAQIDMLQLLLEHGSLLEAVDHFNGPDLDAYTAVAHLLERGFIAVAE